MSTPVVVGDRRPASPYGSYAEYLADLEAELLVRVRRVSAGQRSKKKGRVGEESPEPLERARRARVLASAIDLPLPRLARQWSLSEVEERLVAYLLLLREGTTLPLALKKLTPPGDEWQSASVALAVASGDHSAAYRDRQLLGPEAPLMRAELLEPLRVRRAGSLGSVALELKAEAIALLLDDDTLMSCLLQGFHSERPSERLCDVVLTSETRAVLEPFAHHSKAIAEGKRSAGFAPSERYGAGTVLLFEGPPGTGKTLAARALAGEAGLPLVSVESDAHEHADGFNINVAFVQAFRTGGILFIDEFDRLLEHSCCFSERQLLELLERAPGTVILATNLAGSYSAALERRIATRVSFPLPTGELRKQIWERHWPRGVARTEGLVESLAAHWMPGGYVKNALLNAVQQAAARKDGALDAELLHEAAREQAARFQESLRPRLRYRDPNDIATSTPLEEELCGTLVQLSAGLVDERPPCASIIGSVEAALAVAAELARRLGGFVLQAGPGAPPSGGASGDRFDAELSSLVAGARRQFVAVIVVRESADFATERVEDYLDFFGVAPLMILIAASSSALLEGLSAPLLIEWDGRGPRKEDAPRIAADVMSDPALKSVDWQQVLEVAGGGISSWAIAVRVATAHARARGDDTVKTEDLLFAVLRRAGGAAAQGLFGRVR